MIGGILKGLGAASAIGNVLFGDGGPVVLGDVTFAGMEVPATITWGVKQSLNVHKLPGGARVIDAMGRDDTPLSWSGIFMGSGADIRAARLHEMCVAGQPVPLSWGTHLYTVVVADFSCEDAALHGRYRITCEVLRDESANPATSPRGLLGQIIDDINMALAIIAPIMEAVGLVQAIASDLTYRAPAAPQIASEADVAEASTALVAAQDVAQAAGGMSVGSTAGAALLAAVAVAQTAVATVASAAEASLTGIATTTAATPAAGLLGTTDPVAAGAALVAATSQAGADGASYVATAMLGRVAANLQATPGATEAAEAFALVSPPLQTVGGGAGTTAMVSGGNLFAVAAAQLGDATQAFRIARASDLSDPMLSGLVTLTIPDAIQAISDGVPSTLGVKVL